MNNAEIHKILGGEVQLFQRSGSLKWYCATSLNGRQYRKSTKHDSLASAKDVAKDWYMELHNKYRYGELSSGKTFAQAAKLFKSEYEALTAGRRSPKWVEGHKARLRLHILPFMGHMYLGEIEKGIGQNYRVHRMTKPEDWPQEDDENYKPWKAPAQKTLHNEIVTMNMTFTTAEEHGWIEAVPNLKNRYSKETKISHRPWFTPKEYKQFYEATRRNAANPKKIQFKWHAEQLHDYVLFMANTGLRPDEALHLQFRDVDIVHDDLTEETILEIEVRGKRGVGYCKSMPGAVRPFKRLRDRMKHKKSKDDADEYPGPTDILFPSNYKKMLNGILNDEKLKFDREGKTRTSYSLRHSYICFRLLEGADIYQVAKNCRTSVEMIEKHYAAHLKDMIDTSLVNVRKAKTVKVPE
tara:strand:+ start:17704 stop:18933 length:1230 start_codon:yes stop_codon:yes gene_type:complete